VHGYHWRVTGQVVKYSIDTRTINSCYEGVRAFVDARISTLASAVILGIAVLSRPQIDVMRESLEQGDLNALNQQITVIAASHEPLARALQQLVTQYDYTTLNMLLE
jgi:hypothetical protein